MPTPPETHQRFSDKTRAVYQWRFTGSTGPGAVGAVNIYYGRAENFIMVELKIMDRRKLEEITRPGTLVAKAYTD
jgi:hypothetical protein